MFLRPLPSMETKHGRESETVTGLWFTVMISERLVFRAATRPASRVRSETAGIGNRFRVGNFLRCSLILSNQRKLIDWEMGSMRVVSQPALRSRRARPHLQIDIVPPVLDGGDSLSPVPVAVGSLSRMSSPDEGILFCRGPAKHSPLTVRNGLSSRVRCTPEPAPPAPFPPVSTRLRFAELIWKL